MLRIVTDTGANLPREVRDEFGILAVPLQVAFGDKSYRDEVELTMAQFMRMLHENKHHPVTSQPSAGQFVDTYLPLLQGGDEIVSIHLPRKLSGTVASAEMAKTMLDAEFGGNAPISVLDQPSVSMGQGLLAVEAARAARAGMSRAEVVARVQHRASQVKLFFVLDTLEYLRRGGRIGRATALMGSIFSIKPVLEIADGAVEPIERVRSRQAGFRRLVELVQQRTGGGKLHAAVLHAQALEDANRLAAELQARFNLVEFFLGEIGPVIATHSGPGAFGVAFYPD